MPCFDCRYCVVILDHKAVSAADKTSMKTKCPIYHAVFFCCKGSYVVHYQCSMCIRSHDGFVKRKDGGKAFFV